MTQEQFNLSRHNNYEAWKSFGYKWNNHKGLVLHHIDVTMKDTNIERYIQWNPEDLQVMTKSEHISLHHTGKTISEEQKSKLKLGNSKIDRSSEYWRSLMSECHKGEKNAWYGNGSKVAIDAASEVNRKRVVCVETGIIYESVSDAAKSNNLKSTNISACCKQKYGYNTAGGFTWRYI